MPSPQSPSSPAYQKTQTRIEHEEGEVFTNILKLLIVIIFIVAKCNGAEEFNVTVAQDGSGNYTKISDAVSAAPNHSPIRYNIKIKAGVYVEHVYIGPEKQNMAFIGDGADGTTITGNRSARTGWSIIYSPTVDVNGDNFVAKYITFNNSAGPTLGQAVALKISANFSAFYMCNINGYQDTLFVDRGYQFFRESQIYGTVDFIFGGAPVIFQNSYIYVHNPGVGHPTVLTAQSKHNTSKEASGTVLHNCTIKGAPEFDQRSSMKTSLGRPWSNFATVVVMESFLDSIIDPKGWTTMTPNSSTDSVFYGEYNNTGPGADTSKRVKWAKPGNLNREQAERFTVRNFIQGNSWLPATEIPYTLDLIHS